MTVNKLTLAMSRFFRINVPAERKQFKNTGTGKGCNGNVQKNRPKTTLYSDLLAKSAIN